MTLPCLYILETLFLYSSQNAILREVTISTLVTREAERTTGMGGTGRLSMNVCPLRHDFKIFKTDF